MSRDSEVLSHTNVRELAPEVAEQLLGDGLRVRLPVTGSSMLPFIASGDTLVIEPVAATTRLGLGDVVLLRLADGTMMIHRIIDASRDDQVLTRGDARGAADPPSRRDRVQGRVIRIERGSSSFLFRLGLGPERRVIALLSRCGVLGRAVRLLRRLRPLSRGQAERVPPPPTRPV